MECGPACIMPCVKGQLMDLEMKATQTFVVGGGPRRPATTFPSKPPLQFLPRPFPWAVSKMHYFPTEQPVDFFFFLLFIPKWIPAIRRVLDSKYDIDLTILTIHGRIIEVGLVYHVE